MPELRYTPQRKNRIPEWILTGCASVMVACVIFLMFSLGKKLIWEVLFLLAAVVAVWVSTRYLTSGFTYTIDYDHRWFLVTQRQGKRMTCLCRLDLKDLYLVRPYEARDEGEKKTTRYAYCVTPRPQKSFLLFFRQGEGTVSIRLECDGAFLEALKQVAAAYTDAREELDAASSPGQDDETGAP